MEFIISFVQSTTLKTLIKVYLTFVQDLVFQYRRAMLARNATAASVRRSYAAFAYAAVVLCVSVAQRYQYTSSCTDIG